MIDPALAAPALVGTGATEAYGAAVLDYLGEHGIDTTDTAQIRKALSDPATLAAVKRHAAAKAAEVVGVNIALGGIVQTGGKIVRRFFSNTAEASKHALEVGGGAAGDQVNKVAQTERIGFGVAENAQNWQKILNDAQSKVYSEGEARRLVGEHSGLIYVREGKLKNAGAQKFQETTRDVIYDEKTEKFSSPALRYRNSNAKGFNFIKFDAATVSDAGVALIVKDAKTKLAIFSKGSTNSVKGTLKRVKEALEQNPGFKVIYEFPTEKEASIARSFLAHQGYADHIEAIARLP
jgi:filamentous hemagglutinin